MPKQIKANKDTPKIFTGIVDSFEIPEEIVISAPIISLIGSQEISVENFKTIVKYSSEEIKLNTVEGILVIKGKKLEAKSMTSEKIKMRGFIEGIFFER
jgi:sporulation protein YqfC